MSNIFYLSTPEKKKKLVQFLEVYFDDAASTTQRNPIVPKQNITCDKKAKCVAFSACFYLRDRCLAPLASTCRACRARTPAENTNRHQTESEAYSNFHLKKKEELTIKKTSMQKE